MNVPRCAHIETVETNAGVGVRACAGVHIDLRAKVSVRDVVVAGAAFCANHLHVHRPISVGVKITVSARIGVVLV